MKNLFGGNFLKQAKMMQEKITQLQEEMAQKKVTASSGGGMVEATVNGKQEVLSIKIEPEVLKNSDVSMIEDLVLAAVNEAIKKSKELVTKELGSLTGGMNIPGLF
ncbi:MAG: YbaB/EbfC family nucleoid-associated protein [Deltaproteobacteria bacterium]|nr:YbaB/EbfC family nucleoid-associated protein [Deltaproteobacteria bacterium]